MMLLDESHQSADIQFSDKNIFGSTLKNSSPQVMKNSYYGAPIHNHKPRLRVASQLQYQIKPMPDKQLSCENRHIYNQNRVEKSYSQRSYYQQLLEKVKQLDRVVPPKEVHVKRESQISSVLNLIKRKFSNPNHKSIKLLLSKGITQLNQQSSMTQRIKIINNAQLPSQLTQTIANSLKEERKTRNQNQQIIKDQRKSQISSRQQTEERLKMKEIERIRLQRSNNNSINSSKITPVLPKLKVNIQTSFRQDINIIKKNETKNQNNNQKKLNFDELSLSGWSDQSPLF